jgi:hypothetical protein
LEVGKRKVRLGLEITGLAAYHFAKYGDRLAVSAVAEQAVTLGHEFLDRLTPCVGGEKKQDTQEQTGTPHSTDIHKKPPFEKKSVPLKIPLFSLI